MEYGRVLSPTEQSTESAEPKFIFHNSSFVPHNNAIRVHWLYHIERALLSNYIVILANKFFPHETISIKRWNEESTAD